MGGRRTYPPSVVTVDGEVPIVRQQRVSWWRRARRRGASKRRSALTPGGLPFDGQDLAGLGNLLEASHSIA